MKNPLDKIDAIKFYMNYVGCKASTLAATPSSSLMFYMNYVGCKVFNFPHIFLKLIKFYMNYVGCKGSFVIVFVFDILCFI